MAEGSTHRHSIACELLRETEKAWLIDDGSKEVWMPKSQGEMFRQTDGSHTLFAEEWIRKTKGLI